MSDDKCNREFDRHPTSPHLVAVCTRDLGHDGPCDNLLRYDALAAVEALPANQPREVLLFPNGAVADASTECTCSPHFGAHEPYCGLDLIGYLHNPPTHGDPFLSPWQTNPTAGTPEDAAAQPDMARDLDRALKARDEDDSGNRHTLDEVVEELGIDESDDEGEA